MIHLFSGWMMQSEQHTLWESKIHLSLLNRIGIYLGGLVTTFFDSYQPAIVICLVFAIVSCCVALLIQKLCQPSPACIADLDKAAGVWSFIIDFFAYVGRFVLLLFISVQPDLFKMSILGLIAVFTAVLSATRYPYVTPHSSTALLQDDNQIAFTFVKNKGVSVDNK